jgi:hypothetical protein
MTHLATATLGMIIKLVYWGSDMVKEIVNKEAKVKEPPPG